jgi:uncharacterized protein (DUF433 family)
MTPRDQTTTPLNEHASVLILVENPGAVFTSEQVMRLTGVSRRRLTYWLDHGIVSAEVDEARGRGHIRLWSFANLLEVRVALWLRESVSLQLLGKIVRKLRQRGFASPLAELRVAVVRGRSAERVTIQEPDGTWGEPLSGQLVMELVLPLDRFSAEVAKAAERDRKLRRRAGAIEQHRGRLGSTPVFAGTRIPVAAVQRLLAAGWDASRIVAEYPGLTPADVRAAAERQAG